MEPRRWDDESADVDVVLDVDELEVDDDALTAEGVIVQPEPLVEADPADWVDQHVTAPLDETYER